MNMILGRQYTIAARVRTTWRGAEAKLRYSVQDAHATDAHCRERLAFSVSQLGVESLFVVGGKIDGVEAQTTCDGLDVSG
jgi:hypothetical protein